MKSIVAAITIALISSMAYAGNSNNKNIEEIIASSEIIAKVTIEEVRHSGLSRSLLWKYGVVISVREYFKGEFPDGPQVVHKYYTQEQDDPIVGENYYLFYDILTIKGRDDQITTSYQFKEIVREDQLSVDFLRKNIE